VEREIHNHWTAIVAFDGVKAATRTLVQDPCITFMFVERRKGQAKKGRDGRAGKVRNHAIRHSATADWLGLNRGKK
jgi:hypothetical protein